MAPSLLDDHVSKQQCKRAVEALLSHAAKFEEKKAETQLFSGKEQNVWLVVNTKVMHPEKKLKPSRIPVKYPIVDPRTESVCLITKDPQREYKDLIAKEGIKFISRVVDIRHLKGKWKPFEARRMLLKENGLFLADERVVPLLPALLGKIFFQAKKQPIPVCITRNDLKGELERAISSTYFHQNQGTCSSVKIGTISQKPAQVLANLETALPEVVKHIKGGWDNIQSFFLKTNSSAALPIWQCNLGAESGGRWDGLVASLSDAEDEKMDDASEGESDDDEEMEVEEPPVAASKGKKRIVEEMAEEKPKKKAKAAEKPSGTMLTAPPATGKGKGKAVEASPVSAVDPTPATSEPAKKKRRKSVAEPVTPIPAAAAADQSATPASEGKKRKRNKSQDTSDAPAVAAPTPSSSQPAPPAGSDATTPAKKEKRKKARASLAAATESSDATASPAKAPTPTAPVTPATSKKARASAVDFFDDAAATPAVAAVPPNTPADGVVETPAKRRKRVKGAVADTPVTNAIAKLAAEPKADVATETPSGKKPRHRKTKGTGTQEAVASTPAIVADDTEGAPVEKKRKRKHKEEGAADSTDKPAVSTVSADEIKQKRSVTGVEKKKGKVVGGKPASRSAKDEVVGKKSKKL
ncbi:ribosomal protein L1 [Lentinus tigrinus ALCF2SS1-7]|uniref:Ribosomal protein L1 n=1 Tax=Lentinus tigrinus ALCF2SS1-6 TaxID=1328759 RepID=A0A5C2RYL6_9APHY|nr:ribosomal protein L1 [Lentinus tigrinus ALCF2SS1-6]RPD74008.1 ribosomal protein L1 [Lentinus tigrinus ALCF2SS1-7]